MRTRGFATCGIALSAALSVTAPNAMAQEAEASQSAKELAQQDRILELERKVEVLTEELARMRVETAVPEAEPTLEGYGGFAPAASKIYGVAKGLSLGGYAEGNYTAFVSDADEGDVDRTDWLRLVLYTGYKFTDNIIFNSEIEFEHATTEDNLDGQQGSVSVEFAALDYLWRDEVNARSGLLLVPVGFINELHEPPFFLGVSRPEVERQIIPTTWRDNGGGLFGSFGESLEYRIYALTSLDALGLSSQNLRDARSNGNRSRAEDWAGVLRVDWTPSFLEGLLLGGSIYGGRIDQDREGLPSSALVLGELHAQLWWEGLELRALFTMAHISNAGDLTLALREDPDSEIFGTDETIASYWLGYYLEAAYDVMPWIDDEKDWYLAPFLRVEYVNPQWRIPSGAEFSADRNNAFWLITPGLQFKPTPNVALKFDYRNFRPLEGERADELQLGFGLAF